CRLRSGTRHRDGARRETAPERALASHVPIVDEREAWSQLHLLWRADDYLLLVACLQVTHPRRHEIFRAHGTLEYSGPASAVGLQCPTGLGGAPPSRPIPPPRKTQNESGSHVVSPQRKGSQ